MNFKKHLPHDPVARFISGRRTRRFIHTATGLLATAAVALVWNVDTTSAQTAEQVLKETGISSGLVVHVGTGDGVLEGELAKNKTLLVHGLAPDEKSLASARAAIDDAGVQGLASVELWLDQSRLPYADNLVNLLVADLDALGSSAPTREQILRVVAPRGAAYLKSGGKWAVLPKPLPANMDDWQQMWYDAAGNPVSQDQIVAPPTGLQWISGVRAQGSKSFNGYRIAEGRAVYFVYFDPKFKHPLNAMYTRDAFSGVLLNHTPASQLESTVDQAGKDVPFLVIGDRAYMHLKRADGPLVAVDVKTGKVVQTYDQGAKTQPITHKFPGSDHPHAAKNYAGRVVWHDGKLIETMADTVYVLDEKTGNLLWKRQIEGGIGLDLPVVDPEHGRLFVAVQGSERTPGRNPRLRVEGVAAMDLKTGQPLWRTDFEGSATQMTYADGSLYVFCAKNIFWSDYFVLALESDSGNTRWKLQGNDVRKELGAGQIMELFAVGDRIYLTSGGYVALDRKTGEVIERRGWGNSRCEMSRATVNYLMIGFGAFADLAGKDQMKFYRTEISRSSCASGQFPAYGMLYGMPNFCQCAVTVRGYLALSSEAPTPPIADEKRLQPAAAKPAGPKGVWPAAGEWPIYLASPLRSSWVDTPIAAEPQVRWTAKLADPIDPATSAIHADWFATSLYNGPVTAPTISGGRVFVAVRDKQQVRALDAASGKPLWTFQTGARISTPPTLYGELCIFGCHDGNVYALNAADGKPAWTFRAALGDRNMVAYSQVESTWPVLGSVLIHDGALYTLAGYHPDANGGLLAWALDPLTGAIKWKRPLVRPRDWVGHDEKVDQPHPTAEPFGGYHSNRVINDLMYFDGQAIALPGMRLDPTTGEPILDATPPRKGNVPPPPPTAAEHIDLGFARIPLWRSNELENYGKPGQHMSQWPARLPRCKAAVPVNRIAFKGDDAIVQVGLGVDWRAGSTLARFVAEKVEGRQPLNEAAEWKNDLRPFMPRGMVVAGDRVLLAARRDNRAKEYNPPKLSGHLVLYSLKDGKQQAIIDLPGLPIDNGLAAAGGKVFITLDDGSVVCLE